MKKDLAKVYSEIGVVLQSLCDTVDQLSEFQGKEIEDIKSDIDQNLAKIYQKLSELSSKID